MSMTVVLLKTDEERIVQVLQETVDKLDSVEDEVVLDFTSVRRIGSSALGGMEDFASTAENKGVRVVLCGVSVEHLQGAEAGEFVIAIFFRELTGAIESAMELDAEQEIGHAEQWAK